MVLAAAVLVVLCSSSLTNNSTSLPISLRLKVAATEIKTATSMALYSGARLTRSIQHTRSSYLAKKAKVAKLVQGDLTQAELSEFGLPAQEVINRMLKADNDDVAKLSALVKIGKKASSFLRMAMGLKDQTARVPPKPAFAANLSPLEQAQQTIEATQAELARRGAELTKQNKMLHEAVSGALSALQRIEKNAPARPPSMDLDEQMPPLVSRPVVLSHPHSTGSHAAVSLNAQVAMPKVLALLRNARVLLAEIASESKRVQLGNKKSATKLAALKKKVVAAQQSSEARALHEALQTQEFQVLRQEYGEELNVLQRAERLCTEIAG